MDKKNTMLLTVIAVATLLVAVVGATFAYFSVTSDSTSASTVVNTKTENVGLVSLEDTDAQFYLYMTAAQMANTTDAKGVYYGNTTSIATPAAKNANPETLATTVATAKVAGGDTGVKYHCTFNYSITTTGVDANREGADAELAKAGKLYVISNSTETNKVTSDLIATHALSTTEASGTGTFDLVGTSGSVDIQAYVSLENMNADQTPLAGAQYTTNVSITDLACDTVA